MILHILIDSSTKHTSNTDKRGESIAAWAAWWSTEFRNKPTRSGIHYFRMEGPNKCFYQGIIRALEQCLDMCWSDEVSIWGDCEPVLKQLNKEWAVMNMRSEYSQVQALISKYKTKNNQVTFNYLNESNLEYKNIDQLAKRSHDHILNILKRKNPRKT